MPTKNRRVLSIFFALMAAFVVGMVGWDVDLYQSAPEGVNTISWSMALLGEKPLPMFAFGHATGGILWGLAFHFWFPQPSPKMWRELVDLRKYKADREAQNL